MTQPSKKIVTIQPAVVVFGLDQTGRPKAGRFAKEHAAAAKKAAIALNLNVGDVTTSDLVALTKSLPVGRIHAQGKAFIPSIRRDLFDRVQSAFCSQAATGKAGSKLAAKPKQAALGQSRIPVALRASASNPSATVKSATTNGTMFVALGFDSEHRPCGARYADPNLEVLVKAIAAIELYLYEIKSRELLRLIQTLPVGRLMSNGRAEVPTIRQPLYSELISEMAADPGTVPRGKLDGPLPAQKGLPADWNNIGQGHLVIAQETLDYGWAEAIVVNRTDDMLTLRYRDYPNLPKFYRPHRAVALLHQ